jgi:hypothetical protein
MYKPIILPDAKADIKLHCGIMSKNPGLAGDLQ